MHIIGNDIVDLNESCISPKSNDVRFLNRVFTHNEQNIISRARNSEQMLWQLWGAKETAYKIVSKLSIPPVFSHKSFEVRLVASSSSQLQVTYEKNKILVQVCLHNDKLELRGVYSEPIETACNVLFGSRKITFSELDYWREPSNLLKCFSTKELAGIFHEYSAIVRQDLKKTIAKTLSIDISSIEIIRKSIGGKMYPPYVLLDNQPTKLDISLSHHGKWVAWGLIVPDNIRLTI